MAPPHLAYFAINLDKTWNKGDLRLLSLFIIFFQFDDDDDFHDDKNYDDNDEDEDGDDNVRRAQFQTLADKLVSVQPDNPHCSHSLLCIIGIGIGIKTRS